MKQISVAIRNEPGALAKVVNKIAEAGIFIYFFTTDNRAGMGIARFMCSDSDRAYELLLDLNFVVTAVDVLCIEVEDKPGALYNISKILGSEGMNVRYAYGYGTGVGTGIIILRTDDPITTQEILEKVGLRMVDSEYFSSLKKSLTSA